MFAVVTQPARRRTPGSSRGFARPLSPLLLGIAGVIGLGLVAEIVTKAGLVNSAFLPPFSEVLWRFVTLWGDPTFLADVAATVVTFVLGMLIAVLIAVPLGIAFGLVDPMYRASRAIVELIRPVPPVALVPLVLLVLGSGLASKLVIVVFAAVWPILFNTLYGVHGVDPAAVSMARSFRLSPVAVVRRVVLPSALPFIVTGIRIASSIALIVVVTVELIAGGAEGIGAFIARSRASGERVVDVYAATLAAGVVGLAVNLVLGSWEKRRFGWALTTGGTQ